MKSVFTFLAVALIVCGCQAASPSWSAFDTNTMVVIQDTNPPAGFIGVKAGGSQTPWVSNINGNMFDLLNVNDIFGQEFNGSLFVGDGADLTLLNASHLATGTVPIPQLPVATASSLGVVQIGSGISVTAGVISVTGGSGGTGFPLTSNVSGAGFSFTNVALTNEPVIVGTNISSAVGGQFNGNGVGLTNLNGNGFSGPGNVQAVDLTGPVTVNENATGIGPSTSFAPPNTNYGGHGEIQVIGGVFNYQASDAANAFDGNVVTSAADNPGAIIGIYVTNICTVTRWRYAPQPSVISSYGKEQYMNGVELMIVSDSSFDNRTSIDVTPISFTQSTLYWNPRYQYKERTIFNNTISSAYYCWNFTNSFLGVAELQAFGIGTTNGQPAAPVISPWGGHFTNNTVTVTLSDISTAASIYWTTNAWVGSNLYTGPFNLWPLGSTQSTPVTFQAVAYDSGLLKPFGQVASNAFFYSTSFVPLDDLRDQQGNLIEAHGGCILNDTANGNGFLWYGDFCNIAEAAPNIYGSVGTWCYKSSDLMNWTNMGQVSGIPATALYHYRPKVLFNAQYHDYVLWDYLAGASGNFGWGIATSSIPNGPFTYVNTNAQVFGAAASGDFNLYEAPNGTAYIIANTNAPSGGVWVRQLDPTYTNWTAAPPVLISTLYREAPILVANPNGGFNALLTVGNYYDSTISFGTTNFYCPSSTPMGTWYLCTNAIFAQDPLNIPSASPTNFYNGQLAWALPSPWNTNQIIVGMDHWYNGSTPWWNILSQSYSTSPTINPADGTSATLYNSRQVWLPLTFTGTGAVNTNSVITTNANWALQQWNKLFAIVGNNPIQGLNGYFQGTVTASQTAVNTLYVGGLATNNGPIIALANITNGVLTASTALVSDPNKAIASSATTATELGYVHGVTSGIQAQINAISGTVSSVVVNSANGLTNSSSFTAGVITINYGQTNLWPSTNLMVGGGTVNCFLPVTTLSTNANFTFALPSNIQTPNENLPLITVVNTHGSLITMGFPANVFVTPVGVAQNVTNECKVLWDILPGTLTNATIIQIN